MRAWCLWWCATMLAGATHAAEADPLVLAEEVARYLQSAAKAAYPNAEVVTDVQAADARLKLAGCDELDLSHQPDRLYGRVSVAVKCRAPNAWTLYISANVSVRLPVVVVARAVPRGARVTVDDLALETRDLAALRGDHLTAIAQADGRSARQNLRPGSALEARDLAPAIVVDRGERVQIASSRGGIVVKAPGEALRAGMAGEQIPVRNLQSKRLVQAWVTGTGTVSTSPEPSSVH